MAAPRCHRCCAESADNAVAQLQFVKVSETRDQFTAIIVAFLGRLNPIGILVAGLFLALTFIGGEQAQIAMKIPLDVTKVFQGILLFYVLACDSLILYRFRLIFPSRQVSSGTA